MTGTLEKTIILLEEVLPKIDWEKLGCDFTVQLKEFYSGYLKILKGAGNLSSGNRTFLSEKFQKHLENLIKNATEAEARGSNMPLMEWGQSLTKKADIYVRAGDQELFIEIKNYLEFNHLAAALIEAMLFKKEYPNSKFLIVCWSHAWHKKGNKLCELFTSKKDSPVSSIIKEYVDGIFAFNPKYDQKLESPIKLIEFIRAKSSLIA